MLVDSHCHLDMLDYEALKSDLPKVVQHAKEQGIESILTIGVDLINAAKVISIAEQFDHIYASVGLHPSEEAHVEPVFEDYIKLAQHEKVVAIGETGLDYYYNSEGLENQRERFRTQIKVAHKLKKPIIVHTRQAHADTIAIMREENAAAVGGVMHCFTESYEMAKQALDLGFYISFSGIVTFKNGQNVRDVLSKVPLDRVLVETDAPYLTPVPLRGKPNQPANVLHVAQFIADYLEQPLEHIAKITTMNFQELFLSA